MSIKKATVYRGFFTESQRTPKPPKWDISQKSVISSRGEAAVERSAHLERQKTPCVARHFGLLRNSPLSSIHIHFGDELLVFGASLTSASLSKKSF